MKLTNNELRTLCIKAIEEKLKKENYGIELNTSDNEIFNDDIYIKINVSTIQENEVKDENNITQEERLQNYYTMIREFYYEKNGIKNTIDFLKYMIELLEEEDNK